MIATYRICRTADGRLVPETDPDAAYLAYAVGKEISVADQAVLNPPEAEPVVETKPKPEAKAKPPAADKARKPAANK